MTERFTITDLLTELKTKKAKVAFLASKVGTLSTPSKMPGYAYSTPAKDCITGSRLRQIINSVCSSCYALKGRYLFPNVMGAMERRLFSIKKDRYWHVYMMEMIKLHVKVPYFRWHDSGDLQSLKHLKQIVWIAEQLPDVQFWLPTRENAIVKRYNKPFPTNLCVRVSNHMVDSHKSAKNFPNASAVVTDETLAKGLVCPATRKTSDHMCGTCRACWDTDVKIVNYLKH